MVPSGYDSFAWRVHTRLAKLHLRRSRQTRVARMMTRLLLFLGAVLAAPALAQEAAAPVPAPPPAAAAASPGPAAPATTARKLTPMRFEWVREGPAETCLDKCREWVSAAGEITSDTPRDFVALAQARD